MPLPLPLRRASPTLSWWEILVSGMRLRAGCSGARARTVLPKKSIVRIDLSASADAACSNATKPKLQGRAHA
jgi:hypothetical protein